jgi:superfamily II RNA helicase
MSRPALADRLPKSPTSDASEIFDRFLDWVAAVGLELYPAQEEAILELLAGKHVILNTPTGSGKSLVALALHFKAVCEGRVSFYTSPIKALASEKFFALCDDFGAERVGMLTGDASINADALVRCCTAEVLSNMALRRGADLDAPYVVMDEFHYYSDRDRGVAWQVPLVTLPSTQFLLMSATLGDTSGIARRIQEFTGREVAIVSSDVRPVPLDFTYRETPIHETVADLVEAGKAPVYIVNFTQRECAELAQALTSMPLTVREERERIREAMSGTRLDTPYGKELKRFLSFGIGVHHAGLLPKYRLLVEQLAQKGLLKLICGTDTLGVGVNIPIRTVLFSKLAKFDGKKQAMLSVRDFKQIAGRAGRKGFDTAGSVVAQAPEQVIERKRAEAKGGKKKPVPRGSSFDRPGPGGTEKRVELVWTKETFERLIAQPPETLQSRFRLTHGMVLDLLQRDAERNDPNRRNFAAIRELVERSHTDEAGKKRLLSFAAVLVRSLHRAGIVRMVRDTATDFYWVVVADDLQFDFSLHQALSLYLIETLPILERDDVPAADDALQVLTLVESILEDPELILRKQQERERTKRYQELKAEGADYDALRAELDQVTAPKPMADFLYGTFEAFRRAHPWVGDREVKPKAIGREMVEGFYGFSEYVKHLKIERSEGLLLRYLSQLYKTLGQSVPDPAKTDEIWDVIGFVRTILERTDTSLLEEWESLLDPALRRGPGHHDEVHQIVEAKWLRELISDPRVLQARVRTEMHLLVKALASRDWEAAAEAVDLEEAGASGASRGGGLSSPGEFERAMEPFYAQYPRLVADAEARRHAHTILKKTGERTWDVIQKLIDPEGDELWAIRGEIDLRGATDVERSLVRILSIGP